MLLLVAIRIIGGLQKHKWSEETLNRLIASVTHNKRMQSDRQKATPFVDRWCEALGVIESTSESLVNY